MKQQMSKNIEAAEVRKAIFDLPNDKTSGNDGIPVDFYKVFWRHLENPYMDMLSEVNEQRELHQTARNGVINMIPKAQKNPKILANLRPITILNTDYKILEKVIANRLEPAMHNIINSDQRGFIKGRRISTNIRMIFELMQFAEKHNLEAFILQLDFQKCFDKIDFSALIGALSYFDFPDYIITWTNILYTNFKACTQNNGYFSNKFSIQRGIHQGGPCSSFYFLLCAEMMANMLRENEEIKGIPIGEVKNILGQYADNADIYSLFHQKSYDSIFLCLERFRAISGFTLNYDKTNIFRIGSLRNTNAMFISQRAVTWTNDPVNVLGVWISNSEEETENLNFHALVEKVDATLNSWKTRNSSLIGRILIVNTMIISLFVYRMMVLPRMREKLYKVLKEKIVKFIWNGAKPKIG